MSARYRCIAPDCSFTTSEVYDAAAHSYALGEAHGTRDEPAAPAPVQAHRRICVDDEGKLECVCGIGNFWPPAPPR